MNIHEKLATRGVAFSLTPEELKKVEEVFANRPINGIYLFYDGKIREEKEFIASLTSRVAQLVSIATEGFPIHISRSSIERYKKYGTAKKDWWKETN